MTVTFGKGVTPKFYRLKDADVRKIESTIDLTRPLGTQMSSTYVGREDRY